MKEKKVDFGILPKTNEEFISVTYECRRFLDSHTYLSSSLDSLVKSLVDSTHKTLENLKNKLLIMMKY